MLVKLISVIGGKHHTTLYQVLNETAITLHSGRCNSDSEHEMRTPTVEHMLWMVAKIHIVVHKTDKDQNNLHRILIQ